MPSDSGFRMAHANNKIQINYNGSNEPSTAPETQNVTMANP